MYGKFLAVAALSAGLVGGATVPAALHAQTAVVVVQTAPPDLVVEKIPDRPGPRYVWVVGYHRWEHGRYVWTKGYWALPPRGMHVWVPGHWDRRAEGGWVRVEGHWAER